MSGAATAQWKLPKHQLEIAERQAKILKCPIDSIDSMMACLKSVNFSNLFYLFELSTERIFLETSTRIRH